MYRVCDAVIGGSTRGGRLGKRYDDKVTEKICGLD